MTKLNKKAFLGLDILTEEIRTISSFKMLTKLEQQTVNEKCFDLIKDKNQPTYKVPIYQNWQDRYSVPSNVYSKKELKQLSLSAVNSTKQQIDFENESEELNTVDDSNLLIMFNKHGELSCTVANETIKKDSFLGFYHGRIYSFDKTETIDEDKNLKDVSLLVSNKFQTNSKDTKSILKKYILSNANSYHISKPNSAITTVITPSFYGNQLSYVLSPKNGEKENISFVVVLTPENIKFIGIIAKKDIKKGEHLIGSPNNPNINTDTLEITNLEDELSKKNSLLINTNNYLETIFKYTKDYQEKNKEFGQYFLPVLYFLNFNLKEKESENLTEIFESIVYEKLGNNSIKEITTDLKEFKKRLLNYSESLSFETIKKLEAMIQKIMVNISPR